MVESLALKTDMKYRVTFELENDAWLAQVDEFPQVHTFGATLGKAREYVIDALALWLNVSVDSLKGHVDFAPVDLPTTTRNLVDNAIAFRELAESAARTAPQIMGEAAFALVRETHLSMRDAGELLGVSHQRIQQLLSGTSDLVPVNADIKKATNDFARTLREFLPGGSKDDVGALAAALALVALVAWSELSEK
jgi:predicted RNase H-like HicB family nuclease